MKIMKVNEKVERKKKKGERRIWERKVRKVKKMRVVGRKIVDKGSRIENINIKE